MATPPPTLLKAIRILDGVSLWSGKIVGWLILPMVLSLVYEVGARYLFNAPTVWAYDMTFMLYGSFFMLGAAYTLYRKGHIRTDFFYMNWSVRRQGLVDAVCYVLFFFPGLTAFLVVSWDFFWVSFERGERIVTSPWMPIVYPFKATMPLATLLLLLQGFSELLKSVYAALRGEWL
ncbi:TRAP transporter small permease subunit [Pelomicrobium methylotrophicum]|uniref:TRAP transporter small permease protein n=1 Tax=Pelomicrobium methylotrophicum TaxID=2602750 RepID=A0A5C7ESU0_9PROT|nr:TRAP transporter small permease subunit [Pelomicrobium methylotrophicum]TXF10339.1 TRAP transporter small permease subunit [Pelomicrobium methylotrophicum]